MPIKEGDVSVLFSLKKAYRTYVRYGKVMEAAIAAAVLAGLITQAEAETMITFLHALQEVIIILAKVAGYPS
jgi:hypothetical protein